MMFQAGPPAWPAGAVHDTVNAVMRTAPFRRSVSTTLMSRAFQWISRVISWLLAQAGSLPSGRTIVLTALGLLVILLVARLVLAAVARDPERRPSTLRGRVKEDDPWATADRLAAQGDHEGAAHALYRGVLASLAERERLRRDHSKTSGDYARELRARNSASYQPFRAFARRFDAAVYGHGQIDADLVADLRRLAQPLRGVARAA